MSIENESNSHLFGTNTSLELPREYQAEPMDDFVLKNEDDDFASETFGLQQRFTKSSSAKSLASKRTD